MARAGTSISAAAFTALFLSGCQLLPREPLAESAALELPPADQPFVVHSSWSKSLPPPFVPFGHSISVFSDGRVVEVKRNGDVSTTVIREISAVDVDALAEAIRQNSPRMHERAVPRGGGGGAALRISMLDSGKLMTDSYISRDNRGLLSKRAYARIAQLVARATVDGEVIPPEPKIELPSAEEPFAVYTEQSPAGRRPSSRLGETGPGPPEGWPRHCRIDSVYSDGRIKSRRIDGDQSSTIVSRIPISSVKALAVLIRDNAGWMKEGEIDSDDVEHRLVLRELKSGTVTSRQFSLPLKDYVTDYEEAQSKAPYFRVGNLIFRAVENGEKISCSRGSEGGP